LLSELCFKPPHLLTNIVHLLLMVLNLLSSQEKAREDQLQQITLPEQRLVPIALLTLS